MANTDKASSYFHICTVDPVLCTQHPMQLIICAGRSAPRTTMSRSLSILAGASLVTVFFHRHSSHRSCDLCKWCHTRLFISRVRWPLPSFPALLMNLTFAMRAPYVHFFFVLSEILGQTDIRMQSSTQFHAKLPSTTIWQSLSS